MWSAVPVFCQSQQQTCHHLHYLTGKQILTWLENAKETRFTIVVLTDANKDRSSVMKYSFANKHCYYPPQKFETLHRTKTDDYSIVPKR